MSMWVVSIVYMSKTKFGNDAGFVILFTICSSVLSIMLSNLLNYWINRCMDEPQGNLKYIYTTSHKYVQIKEVKQFWVKKQMELTINYIQGKVCFKYRRSQVDDRNLYKELMKLVRQSHAFIGFLFSFPWAKNVLHFSVKILFSHQSSPDVTS